MGLVTQSETAPDGAVSAGATSARADEARKAGELGQRSGRAVMIAHRMRHEADDEDSGMQSVKNKVLQIPLRLQRGNGGAGFPTLHMSFSFLRSIAESLEVCHLAVADLVGPGRALHQNVRSPNSLTSAQNAAVLARGAVVS